MNKTVVVVVSASLLLGACLANAQSLEERVQSYGKSYGTGYLQPFTDAFGASLNSGWYSTADVSNGISIYIGVKAMAMPIPDGSKSFSYANPFGATDVVPTVFGDKTSKPVTNLPASLAGTPYSTYAPGFGVSFAPMFVPQISAGNIFGTRLILRYLPKVSLGGGYGEINLFGVGAQHSISQYIPLVPLKIAAHVGYQNLSLGDFLTTSAFSIGAEASKSFAMFTVYGGVAYEKSTMSFSYTAKYVPQGQTAAIAEQFNFDIDGTNSVRATLGFALSLGLIKINADYSLASQPVACLGFGFGI